MNNLVIGLGEIGRPLMEVLKSRYHVWGRDIQAAGKLPQMDVVHICYPFSERFVDVTLKYLAEHQPTLCIIHSTVVPGTTDAIIERAETPVVYSPVRGRHGSMVEDLKRYAKFVAGTTWGVRKAKELFAKIGLRAVVFPSVAALELAKLIETTYSGLLIAWAQEMERYSDKLSVNYYDLMLFLAEIDYLPGMAFQPGFIGGHCIMQNLELLEQVRESPFVSAVRISNSQMRRTSGRLFPIPFSEFAADGDE
jgi:UDP-N-acetyl-D-mannosaminuronate dehydrogenase